MAPVAVITGRVTSTIPCAGALSAGRGFGARPKMEENIDSKARLKYYYSPAGNLVEEPSWRGFLTALFGVLAFMGGLWVLAMVGAKVLGTW